MNLPKTYYKLFPALFLLLCVCQAKAQTSDSTTYNPHQTYYWTGVHIGGGTYTINSGFDATVLLHNKFVIGIEASNNLNAFNHAHNRNGANYSLLLGLKLTHMPHNNLMLLSGVSYIEIVKTTGIPELYPALISYGKTYSAVGVPIALKYLVTPVNFMAFDFSASANINSARTYVAFTFGVVFGKVRNSAAAR
jgi:hypothetical protein